MVLCPISDAGSRTFARRLAPMLSARPVVPGLGPTACYGSGFVGSSRYAMTAPPSQVIHTCCLFHAGSEEPAPAVLLEDQSRDCRKMPRAAVRLPGALRNER
jgi:hypothetical protein